MKPLIGTRIAKIYECILYVNNELVRSSKSKDLYDLIVRSNKGSFTLFKEELYKWCFDNLDTGKTKEELWDSSFSEEDFLISVGYKWDDFVNEVRYFELNFYYAEIISSKKKDTNAWDNLKLPHQITKEGLKVTLKDEGKSLYRFGLSKDY
jgi:hypothetical protein